MSYVQACAPPQSFIHRKKDPETLPAQRHASVSAACRCHRRVLCKGLADAFHALVSCEACCLYVVQTQNRQQDPTVKLYSRAGPLSEPASHQEWEYVQQRNLVKKQPPSGSQSQNASSSVHPASLPAGTNRPCSSTRVCPS